jgi:hypothetical protein
MSESVSAVIERLRFVSSPAPAIYLNEALVSETFIAHLGAVESFTRTASREVTGGVKSVVSVGGAKGTQDQIEYDLSDSLTQALVLHTALGAEDQVRRPAAGTTVGSFVEAVGAAFFPSLNWPTATPSELEDVARLLEAECERQTQVARAFGKADADLVSLLLNGDDLVCGSVIDRTHVRPNVAASYLDQTQICFGIMERVLNDLPLFTLLYMRAYV